MARTRILGLIAVFCLIGAHGLLAGGKDDTGYRADYRYTGPQNAQISEDEAKGKDPLMATVFAVVPGVLIHGFGNYYAEDYSFGNRMMAMEIFGGALSWWGYSMLHNPENWNRTFNTSENSTTQNIGMAVKAGGLALVVISWIGDVATASDAAAQYNQDHQLHFKLEGSLESPRLAMAYNF